MKITYGSNDKLIKYIKFKKFTAIKDGLKEFPDLNPLDALQMMEEFGG